VRVIIDTCVWSRFLRRDHAPSDPVSEEVRRLVRADAVQMIGPVRQELLSGAQPAERFEQLKDYLRFYPNLARMRKTTSWPQVTIIAFAAAVFEARERICLFALWRRATG
jgi:hypothetical protein